MSANNKANTLGVEQVKGRKFTEKNKEEEIQLTKLASLGSLASKNQIKQILKTITTVV